MTVPPRFLSAWHHCGIRLDAAYRVTRRGRWRRRHRPREFWTYLVAIDGTVEVEQGIWTGSLSPGDQALLCPNALFVTTVQAAQADFAAFDLRIITSVWADPLPQLLLPAAVHASDVEACRRDCQFCHATLAAAGQPAASVLQVRPVFDALLGRFFTDGFATGALRQGGEAPAWLADLREHLSFQFRRPDLDLADLARRSGYSPSHVSHAFRQMYGTSPMRFLQEVRLTIAARRLSTDPSLSIATVARDCAFKDMSHFGVLFHRHFGCTPTAWRDSDRHGHGL